MVYEKGFGEPITTGICDLPILYNTSRALRVVFSSVELPGDVDTPNKLIRSSHAAKMIAIISSRPGSQSSHTCNLDLL
jgi:hypothetical protein